MGGLEDTLYNFMIIVTVKTLSGKWKLSRNKTAPEIALTFTFHFSKVKDNQVYENSIY